MICKIKTKLLRIILALLRPPPPSVIQLLQIIFNLNESSWTNHALQQETHLVSEFDTVELVSRLEQLRPEGGGDELGMACQLDDHV